MPILEMHSMFHVPMVCYCRDVHFAGVHIDVYMMQHSGHVRMYPWQHMYVSVQHMRNCGTMKHIHVMCCSC